MIAVDTSALLASALDEPQGRACSRILEAENDVLISAGTLAEMLVVAGRRNLGESALRLVDRFGLTVIPVTAASARQVAEAYARWGRGVHPAGLNFADCFSYIVAREHRCPLLFVGDDFARTDVLRAL